MTKTGAQRSAAYRARLKGDRCERRFWITLDEVDVVEALVANGWLRRADAEDRQAVQAALDEAHAEIVIGPRDGVTTSGIET